MSFINKYGLINSKETEGVAENCPLWSWQYILMSNDIEMHLRLIEFINLCKTETKGLYHQRPDNNGSKEDNMSPDQLIPFAAALNADSIWVYLYKHLFTYDNVNGKIDFNRIMQPSAVFFSAAISNKLFIPLVALVCIVACFQRPSETSGKLKAWTMMKSLGMHRTYSVCSWILNKRCDFKTFSGCFLEYFQEEGHPIRSIALRKEL